ncbi:MAG TPA: hypothetical protein VM285_09730 [Polyangia bacterium]|jgi:hypothetical protein|nr:hypothetical protein [Polyangia bacterium]
MDERLEPLDGEWEEGFEGHARAQRRRLAALTLEQRIRWLEEAQLLAAHLAASRTSAPGPD